MKNPLTPLERIERTIEGHEVDRLPILVLTKMFGLNQLNIPLNDCLESDPDVYIESQWCCVEELGHEALWVSVLKRDPHTPRDQCKLLIEHGTILTS